MYIIKNKFLTLNSNYFCMLKARINFDTIRITDTFIAKIIYLNWAKLSVYQFCKNVGTIY